MKTNRPHIPVRVVDHKGTTSGYVRIYDKRLSFSNLDERTRVVAEAEEYGVGVQQQMLERAKREQSRESLTYREQVTGKLTPPKVATGPEIIVPQQGRPIEPRESNASYASNPYTDRIAEVTKKLTSVHPVERAQAQRRIDLLRDKETAYNASEAEKAKVLAHDENTEVVRARAAVQANYDKVATDPTSTTADIEHAQKLKDMADAPDVKAGNIWRAFRRLPETVPTLLEPTIE